MNKKKTNRTVRFSFIWLVINTLFVVYLVCACLWVSPSNITLKMINLFISIVFCGVSYGLYHKFKQ